MSHTQVTLPNVIGIVNFQAFNNKILYPENLSLALVRHWKWFLLNPHSLEITLQPRSSSLHIQPALPVMLVTRDKMVKQILHLTL